LLPVAESTLAEFGGQYIATLNSDDLEKAQREIADDSREVIVKPVLNDTREGGLLGLRFANGAVKLASFNGLIELSGPPQPSVGERVMGTAPRS
jgi:hypothetical protein